MADWPKGMPKPPPFTPPDDEGMDRPPLEPRVVVEWRCRECDALMQDGHKPDCSFAFGTERDAGR